jgi:xylulokinase
MLLVAGVDSSTQSCKVVVRRLDTGEVVRSGSASHPEGTEVHPDVWFNALQEAIAEAGGIADVSAISVGAQQHGMVVLDSDGEVIRPALLWNDLRSAKAALDLIGEIGAEAFVLKTGSIPVASFTITKLRWLRDNEPQNAARVAAVALPHDWITWRLRGFGPIGKSKLGPDLNELKTDRSDASGTGYFNAEENTYERALFVQALGHDAILPKVLAAHDRAGVASSGLVFGAGAGDNAAAALGLGMQAGDVAISIGTSGTVFSVSKTQSHDLTGSVAGFADASGHYLPITVTLNAARVLVKATEKLDVDFDQLAKLALAASPGSGGIVLLPFFEGERTPNLPEATESFHGVSSENDKPENMARAHIEGMLCGLAYGFDALKAQGVVANRLLLIGGGAQNPAVQKIASNIFDVRMEVPVISEYVAEGAAVQAAWALTGERPTWAPEIAFKYECDLRLVIRQQYQAAFEASFPA